MGYFAGLDVSLEETTICVVDNAGKIVREARARSEPEALVAFFQACGMKMERVGRPRLETSAGNASKSLFRLRFASGSGPNTFRLVFYAGRPPCLTPSVMKSSFVWRL